MRCLTLVETRAECILSDVAEMETGSDVDNILILVLKVGAAYVVNRIIFVEREIRTRKTVVSVD